MYFPPLLQPPFSCSLLHVQWHETRWHLTLWIALSLPLSVPKSIICLRSRRKTGWWLHFLVLQTSGFPPERPNIKLPNIKMNPPQVHMCSPSWTLLPPPSPYHPSGSSQCTSPKHPVSCIEPGLTTRFIHDILHVSMPFTYTGFLVHFVAVVKFKMGAFIGLEHK